MSRRQDARRLVPLLLLAAVILSAGGAAVVIWGRTRGLRNNNPGNIRKGDSWQGMAAAQPDPDFVTFISPEFGIRALAKVLLNYRSQGLQTVAQIINRWAPPVENDTSSYVAAVARALNVSPTAPLDVSARLPDLVQAIIRHENGMQPYPAELIARGLSLV